MTASYCAGDRINPPRRRWGFHQVDAKLPECDEEAYLGKGKTLLEKKQDNERFKVPLVLQKAV